MAKDVSAFGELEHGNEDPVPYGRILVLEHLPARTEILVCRLKRPTLGKLTWRPGYFRGAPLLPLELNIDVLDRSVDSGCSTLHVDGAINADVRQLLRAHSGGDVLPMWARVNVIRSTVVGERFSGWR
jgi:hypothetical protein